MDPMQRLFEEDEKIRDLVDSIRRYYVIVAYHTDIILMAMDVGTPPEEAEKSIIEASVGLLKLKTDCEELAGILYPRLRGG